MEGSRTYIHTSVDLFKAQRDSKAFETCWKTLRKTSSNWCVSRSIVFEVGVVFKNLSESGWVSELQLGSQVLHTRALNKIQSPSKSSADPQLGTFVGKSIWIAAAWSECFCRKVFSSSRSLAGIPLEAMTAAGLPQGLRPFMRAGFF